MGTGSFIIGIVGLLMGIGLWKMILSIFNNSTRSSISQKSNDDDGLIYEFQNPSEPKLVVIFFHDILWNVKDQQLYKTTWMSSSDNTSEDCEDCVYWPKAWLGTKYPKAQILSANYDASIRRRRSTTGEMDLHLLTENLWQDILPYYPMGTPIFLAGHGFGGLVIKALVVQMQAEHDELARSKGTHKETFKEKTRQNLESFLMNVKGIMYYNTPFLGSRLAASMRNPPCTRTMFDLLRVNGQHMSRTNESFRKWRENHQDCQARFLLGILPTKVGSFVGQLVEEGSARRDLDRFYTVPDRNHFDIVKPRSKKDHCFAHLCRLISESIEGSAKSASAEFLTNRIIKQIKELKLKQGIWVSIDELAKILETSKDHYDKLLDTLDEACLRSTEKKSSHVYYE